MALRVARILVVFGLALFGLRGVLGLMPPPVLISVVVLVLGGAAALDFVCSMRRDRCLIGELACREGLLSAEGVVRILSVQRAQGGRFGEIAVRERYLSPGQLGELLELQRA